MILGNGEKLVVFCREQAIDRIMQQNMTNLLLLPQIMILNN